MTETKRGILEMAREGQSKTGKDMFFLKFRGESRDTMPISGFGALPSQLQQAFSDQSEIEVEYKTSGKYRNYVVMTSSTPKVHEEHVNVERQERMHDKADLLEEAAQAVEHSGNGYKPASEIPSGTDAVTEGALMLGKCYEAVSEILGHKPGMDGECAMVNSLFIYASRGGRR